MSDLPSGSSAPFASEAPRVIEKYRVVLERANELVDLQASGEKATFNGPDEMMVTLAAVLFSQGYSERYPGQHQMNGGMALDKLHGTSFASGYMLATMEEAAVRHGLYHAGAGESSESRRRGSWQKKARAIAKVAIRFGVLPRAYEVGEGPDPAITEVTV